MDLSRGLSQTPVRVQANLQVLADSAPMLIWMTDENDVCIYLNDSAARLFRPEEQINLAAWIQCIHPDDVARVGPVFRKARESHSEYQVEYRIVRTDGTLRWMMGSGAPRFSASGKFEGYNGTVVDTTDRHQTLDTLAKSEAAFRLLAENSLDLISHHAPDTGIYLYASPSFLRVLGYAPSELLDKISVYDQVHPHDGVTIRNEILTQLAAGGSSRTIQFRVRHRDGRYVWISANVKVLTNPITGEKNSSIAVSRDITLERQASEDLQRREARFRSLARLSTDWYWETDASERFTHISDRFSRLFGMDGKTLLGRTRFEIAFGESQPGLEEYRRKAERREPFREIRYAMFVPSSRKVCHASIAGEPVFENGVFRGYRGTGRNITEEVEAANRLAALSAENNALVENALDIIMLYNDAGIILRANRAVREVLGYALEEMTGRHYLEFVVPEDRDRTLAAAKYMHGDGNSIQGFENRWCCKDGSLVHLSWSARRAADHQLSYAIARDVTGWHRIQAELAQSKDRLSSMLETMSEAFFTMDRDWKLTYVNRKAAVFARQPVEKLIGRTVWDAVPTFRTSSVLPYFERAMTHRQPVSFQSFYEPAAAWGEVRIHPHDDGVAVFFHDITEQYKAQEAIVASEGRFRQIIEMTPAGYGLVDAQGTIREVNRALCCLSGYSRDELTGQTFAKLFPVCPCGGALLIRNGTSSFQGIEGALRHKDGHTVHVLLNVNIDRDPEGNGLFLTAFLTDISDRKKAQARLELLATHDTLTGLPNRAYLNTRLQEILDASDKNAPVAVMFIDLDRFKEVNDTMGHDPGDALLREVAARLRRIIRPNDLVARLGGDEFIVAAHCPKGAEAAIDIAETLLSAINQPYSIAGSEVVVSASIGISLYPHDGQNKEVLYQNADLAMYSAKAAGRNAYRFFQSEMSAAARLRASLESALRHAVARREFELHYQPRMDLRTMGMVGMEALIRWNHPELGQIPPLQFIPLAEESHLIEQIGLWVLEEACSQGRRLVEQQGRPLRLSVNLSPRHLKAPGLVADVQDILARTGFPAGQLELELTETALMEDLDTSANCLAELKALGISLSVDDFGTGYSSLAYLQRFPLDVLKLDRSFVKENANGTKNLKFIKAFLDLAHALNLSVVAEGIETEDTLALLREYSCDEGQGYLFSKPLPMQELEMFSSKCAVSE